MHSHPNWKGWFVFSKKDRKVAVTLAIFIVVITLWTGFYSPAPEPPVIENLDDALATLSSQSIDSTAFHSSLVEKSISDSQSQTAQSKTFYFDPNTLDEAGFTSLGLKEKTIRTIINYRNKGGHFYKPDDLRKIYGLTPQEADKLLPFVRMETSKNEDHFTANHSADEPVYTKEKPQVIDINKATVAQWKALPAIGDALSNRIVKYRDKMGGFTSLEQVKQTYGLSDSAYLVILPYLRLSSVNTSVQTAISSQKININKASANELKSNPAIPAEVADAIVIYRKAHGNYSSVSDIKKIVFITDELYQKISPYLIVE